MTQTILGIFIGIMTSFIAGILLIWKGDQFLHFFKRLPEQKRIDIYSKAYLNAINSYPYRYVHLQILTFIATACFAMIISYAFMTYITFRMDLSLPPDQVREAFHTLLRPKSQVITLILNPWFLLGVTLTLSMTVYRIVFLTIPSEFLVPYAHREIIKVRECVSKCATKKQFIDYTNAEQKAENTDDLRELLHYAKTIIGSLNLELADEILKNINPNNKEDVQNSVSVN